MRPLHQISVVCLSVCLFVRPSTLSVPHVKKHTESVRFVFHQCRLTSRQGLTRKHGRSNFAGTASSEHHRIRENLQQLSAHAIMYTPSRSIAQGRCARMARQACSIANRMTEQFRRSKISRTVRNVIRKGSSQHRRVSLGLQHRSAKRIATDLYMAIGYGTLTASS